MIKPILYATVLSCGLLLSCSGGGQNVSNEEADRKVVVEASLFDCKLKQDGKPTSFRLHIYRQDSTLGLGGRGYLGKGALKGRVTNDSITVFFPQSSEYVQESMSQVLSRSLCTGEVGSLRLPELFGGLPDFALFSGTLGIIEESQEKNRKNYRFAPIGCDWTAVVSYDQTSVGWRVREFSFETNGKTSIKGKRREFKPNARVPKNRLRVKIPSDAIPIRP